VFLKASIRATGESGHFNSLTDDIIDTIMEHASNAHHDAGGNSMMYWHGLWSSQSLMTMRLAFAVRDSNSGSIIWQKTGRKKSCGWVEQVLSCLTWSRNSHYKLRSCALAVAPNFDLCAVQFD
jgi:hypothetical protein